MVLDGFDNLVDCEQGSCAKTGMEKVIAKHEAIASFLMINSWGETIPIYNIYSFYEKSTKKIF
jgi:hypothetical protein